MVARGADMAEVALAEGIDAAVNRFHASPPGARARARARAARRRGGGEPRTRAPERERRHRPRPPDPRRARPRRGRRPPRRGRRMPTGSRWRARRGPSRWPPWPAARAAPCWPSRRATTRRATWRASSRRCSAAAAVALWPTRGLPVGRRRRRRRRTSWASGPARWRAWSGPGRGRGGRAGPGRAGARRAGPGGAARDRRGRAGLAGGTWLTVWSRWATSACLRWRSAATCRCAGGILDVYPSTADLPARIELFGDEVESMRAFWAFTQRTIRPITRAGRLARRRAGGGAWADALDDPGPGGARVVRLAPAEHAAALREARERLEDEAAAGELADPGAVDAALAGLSAPDLAPTGRPGRRPPRPVGQLAGRRLVLEPLARLPQWGGVLARRQPLHRPQGWWRAGRPGLRPRARRRARRPGARSVRWRGG